MQDIKDIKTLVLGVSLKENRYSNKAVNMLRENDVPTVAFGLKKGKVADVTLDTELMPYKDIHTVSIYIGPQNQQEYYDYVIGLNPKRVIFNPGTENEEFFQLLDENNIPYQLACTLVLLRTGQFGI